ncbi:MAG: glycosyltransferase, partial [Candidatus Eisenbacteria bacterium]
MAERNRKSGSARTQPARARAPKRAAKSAKSAKSPRLRRRLKIGISCYAHFGGSGVVASELGRELARRGHEVHLIASHLPFRLRSFEPNMSFHEAAPAHYPVFEDAPSNLALATKMVEVVENYTLDVLHVHYAMPFATSAYLAKQIMLPRQLGVVTTLHGTDITVVGAEPAFFRLTQFSM